MPWDAMVLGLVGDPGGSGGPWCWVNDGEARAYENGVGDWSGIGIGGMLDQRMVGVGWWDELTLAYFTMMSVNCEMSPIFDLETL